MSERGVRWLSQVLLLGVCLILLAPLLLTLVESARAVVEEGASGVVQALGTRRVSRAVTRSVVLAAAVATVSIVFTATVVASIREGSVVIRRTLGILLAAPLLVPSSVHAIVFSRALAALGMGKSWTGLGLALAVYVLPFAGAVAVVQERLIPRRADWVASDCGLSLVGKARLLLRTQAFGLASGWLLSWLLAFNEYSRAYYLAPRELFSVLAAGSLTSGGTTAVQAVSLGTVLVGILVLGSLVTLLIRAMPERAI